MGVSGRILLTAFLLGPAAVSSIGGEPTDSGAIPHCPVRIEQVPGKPPVFALNSGLSVLHPPHDDWRRGCAEDGSFRFDKVPADVYQLKVTLPVEHDGPATEIRFAEAFGEVTVSDAPGRRSGQPFELGVLRLEFKETPGSMSFSDGGSGGASD